MPTQTRKPRTTRTPRKPLPRLQLPEHVQPNDHELAVFARYVRCSRESAYWLPVIVEYLLFLDTETTTMQVPAQSAIKTLNLFAEAIRGDQSELNEGIKLLQLDAPGFRPKEKNPKPSGVFTPEDEDYQFMELVELWRKDHPEPPKWAAMPQGHLGRGDESGD